MIKNNNDPKIETVKHLELIYLNNISISFNITSKVCKFPGYAYGVIQSIRQISYF